MRLLASGQKDMQLRNILVLLTFSLLSLSLLSIYCNLLTLPFNSFFIGIPNPYYTPYSFNSYYIKLYCIQVVFIYFCHQEQGMQKKYIWFI